MLAFIVMCIFLNVCIMLENKTTSNTKLVVQLVIFSFVVTLLESPLEVKVNIRGQMLKG